MQYVKLGSTGLDVSRICLGCMTYGVPDRGTHEWTLDEEASRPLIRQALEAGVNFFDTANVYSDGTSEEIVGKALRDFAHRDEIVLATKVHGRTRPGPNGAGLWSTFLTPILTNTLLFALGTVALALTGSVLVAT
ncbi:aldo/keto reductase, partial [Streptomyces sp. NPDC001356]